jgi:RNA polymerase sigma factor (sigma-70 family)
MKCHTASKPLIDNEFIQALKQKSESAFKTLVETYQDRVYNTCMGIVQNADDAEELAQDVFIEVYHSIHSFDERSSVSTWIYRIATNKSLDKLRFNKRKKRAAIFYRLFQGGNDDLVLKKAEFVHPGVKLEEKESAAILFAAIEQLPEKQKTAFILLNLEGLSYQEIADIMQASVSSVESLLYRGRENLRKLLAQQYKNLDL